MSPQPGPLGSAPPPKPFLQRYRWPVAALAVALVAGGAVFLRRAGLPPPGPLQSYEKDTSVLEKEYRLFHGRLLREPELESQFHIAAELVAAKNHMGAIDVLEKVSRTAAVPVVFHDLGLLYAAAGDRGRAVAAFREALARDAEYKPVRDAIERLRLFTTDEANPVRQEIEPNNSEVVANLIAVGRPIDGEITAGDTDTFRFITPAAPRDILELHIENVDRTLEMGIRMHDGEMTNETARVLGAPGDSLQRYIAQAPNKALFLQLWGAQKSAGKYKVSIRPMKSFDALEPNDDIFNARRIEIGATVQANIMDSEDSDFYSFQGPRDGTVTIELQNESNTLIPALTTFNSERRNTGFGPDVRKPGAGLTHTMEVRDFQTYYVQIWPQAVSSGKYQLTIR